MCILLGGVAREGSDASSLNGSAIKTDIALEALDAACRRFREVSGCGDGLVSAEAMPKRSISAEIMQRVRYGAVFRKVVV